MLVERFWDVSEHQGRNVRLVMVDMETGPGGWIAVDGIEERMQELSGVANESVSTFAKINQLRATPTPFNGRTEFRMNIVNPGSLQIEVFDLRGYRVWYSTVRDVGIGPTAILWNTSNSFGQGLPSGTYLGRVLLDGEIAGKVRLTLVE